MKHYAVYVVNSFSQSVSMYIENSLDAEGNVEVLPSTPCCSGDERPAQMIKEDLVRFQFPSQRVAWPSFTCTCEIIVVIVTASCDSKIYTQAACNPITRGRRRMNLIPDLATYQDPVSKIITSWVCCSVIKHGPRHRKHHPKTSSA